MSDGLDVTGGVGGVAAHVADLRATADRLDASGDQVRDLAGEARLLTMDADLVGSTVLSPGTASMAVATLLDVAFGSRGLTASGLRLEAGASGLRTVATMFETRDAAVAASIDLRNRTGGYLLGRVLLPAGALAYGGSVLHQATEVKRDLLSGRIRSLDALQDRVRAVPGDAGGNLATGLDHLLAWHPDLVDVIAGGSPELSRGLLDSILPVPLGSVLGPSLPRTFEEVTASIMAFGASGFGAFDDSRPITVRPVPLSAEDRVDGAIESLQDVFLTQAVLWDRAYEDPDSSRIRVIDVVGSDGQLRHIVQVPGTQAWNPVTGGNPSDLTTNLALEAHHDAAMLQSITDALTAHGVRADTPILLTGHSQGGIAAAAFAAHPDHGDAWAVTHVITGGSPIGRIPVPDHVQVLAIEHLEDPVPRLEGAPNADRVNLTTVVASVMDHPGVAGRAAASHGAGVYADTGALIDQSGHPSIDAFRAGVEPFLAGSTDITDYLIAREGP